MSNVRQATNKLIELAEEGVVSWESLALACLRYMSEDEVKDLAESEGFIDLEEEEFEQENEDADDAWDDQNIFEK